MLKGMVDEVCGTMARLIAYLGTLALLFIVGVYLWDQLPEMHAEASTQPNWMVANRSTPAFASNQRVSLDDHIVRVGVNYKLPWGILDSFFKR